MFKEQQTNVNWNLVQKGVEAFKDRNPSKVEIGVYLAGVVGVGLTCDGRITKVPHVETETDLVAGQLGLKS